jgi:hypothetical protein
VIAVKLEDFDARATAAGTEGAAAPAAGAT